MNKILAPAALALVWSLSSHAETSSDQTTVYLPQDFAQYAPLNARDMVERIPGFRLSDSRGQNESRGLGQATENVLINGQRLSSKSSSAADVLQRIPAETVRRIELLRCRRFRLFRCAPSIPIHPPEMAHSAIHTHIV
ncbi:MAG: TonB-dependent receptor plug domain-containing protein, partial [Pseudomonadota bacterium]|nr:TonB-dependent receptor plug domain-containing protein [Pseudomonadota bacterium]